MSHSISGGVSFVLAILTFAGMQAFRTQLASTQAMTIVGGFLGSNIFLFLLTFVSNFEMEFFGEQFQAKIFPEVLLCLFVSVIASAFIHRVCITVCILCSFVLLYAMNQISNAIYSAPATISTANGVPSKRKQK